jgi:hypothetical protein
VSDSAFNSKAVAKTAMPIMVVRKAATVKTNAHDMGKHRTVICSEDPLFLYKSSLQTTINWLLGFDVFLRCSVRSFSFGAELS